MRTAKVVGMIIAGLMLAGYAPGLVHDIVTRATAGVHTILSPLTPERPR